MRTSKLTLIEHSRILCKAVPLHDKQVQKRVTGIAPFALEPGASRRQMVGATSRPLYPRETNPLPIVRGVGWTSGPLWMGPKNYMCHILITLQQQCSQIRNKLHINRGH
jgi:hypothetical protein